MRVGLVRSGAVAIAITIATVVACGAVSRLRFNFSYDLRGMALDFVILLPAIWLVTLGARWKVSGWLLAFCIGFLFILGHSIKISLLGAPVSFDDAEPLLQLLRVLHGWRLVLACVAMAAMLLLLLLALWPRKGGLRYQILVLAYLAALPFGAFLFQKVWPWESGPVKNVSLELRREGGILFVVKNLGTSLAEREGPQEEIVKRDISRTTGIPRPVVPKPQRNVHIILMESMWDPLQLHSYQFDRDPWDHRLRELWNEAGNPTVLSPVFGGATANAEFEVLCGLPATSGRVVFETSLRNAMPCLPALLREDGYFTTANHPYRAQYWSRDKAYAKLGFEQYNPLAAYKIDDVDGMFLNDRSAFFQTLERLNQAPSGRPYLAYVVSLSSHYPFDRDRQKRPDRVHVRPEAKLLQDYSNAISYSTEALSDYVEAVRERDPKSLIVIFGDHAPMLGNDPDPYVESGLRSNDGRGTRNPVAMSSTPVLVIDGKRGVVNTGHIPLYALPVHILELLGRENLPYANLSGKELAHVRMFLGELLAEKDHKWIACTQNSPGCDAAADEGRRLRTLRDDLSNGKQYSLDIIGGKSNPLWTMKVNETYGSCKLDVQDWGPRSVTKGVPFNIQPGGASAFWMKIREARGDLRLRIGDEDARLTVSGEAASFSFGNPKFLSVPGDYPVSYYCDDGQPTLMGTFKVAR